MCSQPPAGTTRDSSKGLIVPVQPSWILAASTAKNNSGGSGFLIIVLFGGVALYLFTRSQKKARRRVTEAQGAITLGSRVITTSGMYATVVRVDDTTYDLEVDTDVIITFVKAAVTRLAPVEAEGDTDEGDDHDHNGDHDHPHDGDHDHDHAHGDAPVILTKSDEDPARSSSES